MTDILSDRYYLYIGAKALFYCGTNWMFKSLKSGVVFPQDFSTLQSEATCCTREICLEFEIANGFKGEKVKNL